MMVIVGAWSINLAAMLNTTDDTAGHTFNDIGRFAYLEVRQRNCLSGILLIATIKLLKYRKDTPFPDLTFWRQ